MNKNIWIPIVVAVIVGASAFWGGMTYAQGQAASARAAFAGGAGFAGRASGAARFGAAGGGTAFGSIVSVGPTSITVQLTTGTSTTAQSGSKIVLYDSSTQVQELQSVPASNLKVGQNITVAGTVNSDGSITATSIMVRPAGAPRGVATGQ